MITLIELRNYLLKPGYRERFMDYFKTHFVDSQEELGGFIPGMFRIKNQEDRFCWIRGFENMQTRSEFLPSFYGGKVWEEYGPAANDMMLEWHQVHLLKPINIPGIDLSDQSYYTNKLVVADGYIVRGNCKQIFTGWFENRLLPFLQKAGIETPSLWECELSTNDFPGLPVIQDKNTLVAISVFKDEKKYEAIVPMIRALEKELGNDVVEKNSLLLMSQ